MEQVAESIGMNDIWIGFEPLPHCAGMPTLASPGAAAWDCRSTTSFKLWPGQQEQVGLGFVIAIPHGFCADLLPLSSLGAKGVVLGNMVEVLNSDYRSEVTVCLWNRNQELPPCDIKRGDRICQLVFRPVIDVHWQPMGLAI